MSKNAVNRRKHRQRNKKLFAQRARIKQGQKIPLADYVEDPLDSQKPGSRRLSGNDGRNPDPTKIKK